MPYYMHMIADFFYALGRRMAMAEELQKHAATVADNPLLRHVLPALGLGALLAPLGAIAGRASISRKDIKGPLWGGLPPTQGQVDLEKELATSRGAMLGLGVGAGVGALSPYWAPLLLRKVKTIGSALL